MPDTLNPDSINQWSEILVGQGVCFCFKPVADHTATLTPAEQDVVASSVAIRKNTYSSGRYCAKSALQSLGVKRDEYATGLLRQSDGSVGWPHGTIGSISHTNDWAVAAVAKANIEFASIGIDVEQIDRVENDVLRLIATDQEREVVKLATGLPWARVAIFSIKESLYKCLRPIYGEFIRFKDVELSSLDSTASLSANPNINTHGVRFYSPSVQLLLPELCACCDQSRINIRLAVLSTHVISFVSYSA